MEKQINELEATITRIQAPNMRAIQKLDEAREKLEETNKEFDNARRKAKTAKMNFERIKQERYDLFMKCFDHVSNHIDEIYKSLAKNQSAQGTLFYISYSIKNGMSFKKPTQRKRTEYFSRPQKFCPVIFVMLGFFVNFS